MGSAFSLEGLLVAVIEVKKKDAEVGRMAVTGFFTTCNSHAGVSRAKLNPSRLLDKGPKMYVLSGVKSSCCK
jgi:hypothetical protein